MKKIYGERIDRLKKIARAQGIESILLVPGVNLFYITGLHMGLSERITLIGLPVDDEPFAIVPQLEAEKVAAATRIRRIFSYTDSAGPESAIKTAFGRGKIKRFGIEYRYMRVLEFELLRFLLGQISIFDIGPMMSGLRSRKDENELKIMKEAAKIADALVAVGARAVRPGVSEKRVEGLILDAARRHNAQAELSVASGPNSAIPHSRTTERIIQSGDAVWIDIVVYYKDYVADITRTCFAGKPAPEMLKIFRIVYEAQKAGRTRARAGMTGAEVDALCRNYIAAAGYGKYFIHRTGHGIGLEVHEEPYIVKGNNKMLKENMIFTIEPGIYLPGKGGVRIEDDVLLTKRGCHSLTSFERNLVR